MALTLGRASNNGLNESEGELNDDLVLFLEEVFFISSAAALPPAVFTTAVSANKLQVAEALGDTTEKREEIFERSVCFSRGFEFCTSHGKSKEIVPSSVFS